MVYHWLIETNDRFHRHPSDFPMGPSPQTPHSPSPRDSHEGPLWCGLAPDQNDGSWPMTATLAQAEAEAGPKGTQDASGRGPWKQQRLGRRPVTPPLTAWKDTSHVQGEVLFARQVR